MGRPEGRFTSQVSANVRNKYKKAVKATLIRANFTAFLFFYQNLLLLLRVVLPASKYAGPAVLEVRSQSVTSPPDCPEI